MPWTLYRYILRELSKVLALTTAVMVVVLSFGVAIGPLSDGLLGPVALIKFVVYTMPSVLGFALPFAGAFSATVVFHGMAKDNEVLACRAGGLSYSRIFAPVVILGVVLMLVLLVLSNTLVPGFWKSAKRTVQGNVLGVLVSQLNQDRPVIFGDDPMVLSADAAESREPPPGLSTGSLIAESFVVMQGVAVGQLERSSQRVLNDTTASTASALLLRDPVTERAYLTLNLKDPVHYDAVTGEFARVGQFENVQTDRPILLPDPLEDQAVFYDLRDLMALKKRPHDFDMVREAQADLAAAVSRQQMTHLLVEGLSDEGGGFVKLRGGLENTFYRLSAPVVEPNDRGLVLLGGDRFKVTLDKFDNEQLRGEALKRFEADYAEAVVKPGRFSREPEVRLTMRNVRVLALNDTGDANEKPEYAFPPMRLPTQVLGKDPSELTADELNAWSVREEIRDAAGVQEARGMLRFRIIQLKYMIDAELYSRFATAIATPLLLLLGTLLAVRMHDRLPLAVFFWAFLLAIVTLVMIRTGHSMAKRITIDEVLQGVSTDRLIGVAVLWGGNLLLLLVNARLYLKIAKH